MCEKGQLIAPFLLEIDIFTFFLINDVQVDVFVYLKDVNSNDYIENFDFSYSTWSQTLPENFWSAVWMDVWLYKLVNWKESWWPFPVSHPWSDMEWYFIQWNQLNIVWGFWVWESLRFRYLTKTTDLNEVTDETIFDDDRRLYPSIRNMLNMLYECWKNNDYDEIRAWNKYIQDAENLCLLK